MAKFKALYEKYKEIILYLIFGVLTTVVNYVIFSAAVFIGIDVYISNAVAWMAAVLFAYVTNRKVVFNSQANDRHSRIKEVLSFYGARVLSFVIEEVLLIVFVSFMHMNEYISKLILQVVVVVLNYIFSKFLVFRKKKD